MWSYWTGAVIGNVVETDEMSKADLEQARDELIDLLTSLVG